MTDLFSDSFGIYLSAIKDFPQLSKAEQMRLVALAQKGDARAREKIVSANLKFVVAMARSFGDRCRVNMEDLVQAGNIGLLAAVEKFDADANAGFLTYAKFWILNFISNEIEFQLCKKASSRGYSLVSSDTENFSELESHYDATEDAAIREVMAEKAMASVRKLPDAAKEVIMRRFGLCGRKESTLAGIGKSMGCSRERIRQVEASALKKIKSEISA